MEADSAVLIVWISCQSQCMWFGVPEITIIICIMPCSTQHLLVEIFVY